MVDAGAIAHLAQMILNPDSKLKVRTYNLFLFQSIFSYISLNFLIAKLIHVSCLYSLPFKLFNIVAYYTHHIFSSHLHQRKFSLGKGHTHIPSSPQGNVPAIVNPSLIIFQRQVFSALSQIAKHSVDLAEMVVEAEIFPAVLTCLKGIVFSRKYLHWRERIYSIYMWGVNQWLVVRKLHSAIHRIVIFSSSD